jgi:hypothetical protein
MHSRWPRTAIRTSRAGTDSRGISREPELRRPDGRRFWYGADCRGDNTGPAVLSLLAVTIDGLNSGDLAKTNTCGPTLAVGERCTIRVNFTPTATGLRTALLFIAGNITGGESCVNLSGAGIAAAAC